MKGLFVTNVPYFVLEQELVHLRSECDIFESVQFESYSTSARYVAGHDTKRDICIDVNANLQSNKHITETIHHGNNLLLLKQELNFCSKRGTEQGLVFWP